MKKEKEITEKIQTMIDEQKRLLNEGLDISKDGDIVKVKKEWNDDILTDGGIIIPFFLYEKLYPTYNTHRKVKKFIKQQIKKSKLIAEQEKTKRLNKITDTLKGV